MYKKGWKSTNGNFQQMYKEVRQHALSLYPQVSIPQNCWISNRMGERTFGQYTFSFRKEGTRLKITDDAIVFSSLILSAPNEDQLETIIHEIAHCVANKISQTNCSHNFRWRSVGNAIGAKYRISVETHVKSPEVKKLMAQKRNVGYRYQLVCEKCGKVCGKYKSRPRTKWLHTADMGRCICKPIQKEV